VDALGDDDDDDDDDDFPKESAKQPVVLDYKL
jgi:hypothetical protein